MKIILITPAAKLAKNGNRTTAIRWARILRKLGHQVEVDVEWDGRPADMMVAIHAWHSAQSALQFREHYPKRPLIVLLAGTDIYRFQKSHPKKTYRCMEIADGCTLHGQVYRSIPAEFISKLHVIASVRIVMSIARKPSVRHFDICVVGHLREEKDPLRTAMAVRNLPPDSKIRVIHLGKAHSADWADKLKKKWREILVTNGWGGSWLARASRIRQDSPDGIKFNHGRWRECDFGSGCRRRSNYRI